MGNGKFDINFERKTLYPLIQLLVWGGVFLQWLAFQSEMTAEITPPKEQYLLFCLFLAAFGLLLSHYFLHPWMKNRMASHLNFHVAQKLFLGIVIATTVHISLTLLFGMFWLKIDTQYANAQHLIVTVQLFFITWLGWAFFYYAFIRMREQREARANQLQLELALKNSTLDGLRHQLNPHFIFNALNSIRAMVLEDPHASREMITELSGLLRYSLYHSHQETVPLSEELEVVKDYIHLEQRRYESNLRIEFDIDDTYLDCLVPPLSLQTLVENAIKHNINDFSDGIDIQISAKSKMGSEENAFEMIVNNRGSIKSRNDSGVGLSNLRKRLKLIFSDAAQLTLEAKNKDRVEALLRIPMQANNTNIVRP